MQLNAPNTNMLVDVCESRLTVHISVHNLRNMDAPVIGRSDPFALLFLDNTGTSSRSAYANANPIANSNPEDPNPTQAPSSFPVNALPIRSSAYTNRDPRWQRVGATETVWNSHNAIFATSFEIPYFFERAQRIAVDVFDRDVHESRDDQLHLHDFLGYAELSVPSLVRARGQRLTVPLRLDDRPNLNCGSITVAVEEVFERKQRIHYNVVIDGLGRRHGDGPYLTISRRLAGTTSSNTPNNNLNNKMPPRRAGAYAPNALTPLESNNKRTSVRRMVDDTWCPVYRSTRPAVPHGRRFLVNEMSHNYEKLCRCDDDVPLQFDISYQRMGKLQVVATGTSTLAMAQSAGGVVQLSSLGGGCCKPSRPSLTLKDRRITEDTTFLDYIIGGCEISLVLAIDFTASNGDPSQRGSLHFWDSMDPNEYDTAVRVVGDILASYDTDQRFPVFGFGAKLPPNYSHPCHCFSITEDAIVEGTLESVNDYCYTIDGVLNAYRHALYNVRLSGPTVFSEIVQAAADHSRAEARDNDQAYTILLIITDGVINDVDQTLEALYQASSLPISVVIIGVGEADFSDMVILDGDDTGRERDIVQFVNFRQYKDTPEILRSQVLEEIPSQFLQYMRRRNIRPLPPPEDDADEEAEDSANDRFENGSEPHVHIQSSTDPSF